MPGTEDLETTPEIDAQAGGTKAEGNGTGAAEPEKPDSVSQEEMLRSELERAETERADLLDKLLRAQADFENIRKRLQKEKEDVIRYAASDTIKSLLPIVDDFERALATDGIPPDLKKGLELIYRRIFEAFERAGLKEVAQHDSFDPSLHFAVDSAPAGEGQTDQQIIEVYQKGSLFKDRLLRASMVKVAVEE